MFVAIEAPELELGVGFLRVDFDEWSDGELGGEQRGEVAQQGQEICGWFRPYSAT